MDKGMVGIMLSVLLLWLGCGGLQANAAEKDLAKNPIAVSAEMVHPIMVGSKTPDGMLSDADQSFELSGTIAEKSSILIFYRGGW
ncbi:MAG: hypothetical protein JRJ23_10740 [Deltaproteobacteria bacterium]|nr:hypothetical protein [Deltaproteobacteria bacterium]